jgi:hypothetical protein
MTLAAETITLIGLVKIELPDGDVRLCDGGFCYFGGEKYTSEDPIFGSIAAVDELEAALGDSAEDAQIVFNPADDATPAQLSSKAFQNARARFWMGKLDTDGKTVVNAEQLMDGLVDFTVLRLRQGSREIEMSFIGRAEKLFLRQEGNTLDPRFHKSVWPGEKGLDNATGARITVAWGVGGARGIASGGAAGAMLGGGAVNFGGPVANAQ